LLVTVIGLSLAFCGNALSPRGLSLTQNFFPTATKPADSAATTGATATLPVVPTNSATDELATKLKAQGLGLVNGDKVVELYNDPRHAQNLVVFIDARHDEEYQAGHIPGAYQFDYYYANKYLGTVVPVLQTAEQVIVYCKGGECEDSVNAAIMLKDFIPKEKLMVYGGGIAEWTSKGQPVESGDRNSGKVHK
jgi:rhodanese-related sulfurtransferase